MTSWFNIQITHHSKLPICPSQLTRLLKMVNFIVVLLPLLIHVVSHNTIYMYDIIS
ncbi:hypothetical protein HanIR_Chr07g0299941 [Helianthus annuus]|nr:hypothetical protein HanIR_Chr07g0299941 [Helianthus annuus]